MDADGVIEVHEEGKVISINEKTDKVEYEIKESPLATRQKWTLGSKDYLGWQTIQHVETGFYLTARYRHPGPILTAEKKGRYLERNEIFRL